MRLRDFKVANFRSISDASVACCGRFNVFIGRNNSGKSNTLAAIVQLLRFLQRRAFASRIESMDRARDWHGGETDVAVRLIGCFELDKLDLEGVRKDVAGKPPRLAEIADRLQAGSLLRVRVDITDGTPPLAFLAEMAVVDDCNQEAPEHVLSELTGDVAASIASEQRSRGDLKKELDEVTYLADYIDRMGSQRPRADTPGHTSGSLRADLQRRWPQELHLLRPAWRRAIESAMAREGGLSDLPDVVKDAAYDLRERLEKLGDQLWEPSKRGEPDPSKTVSEHAHHLLDALAKISHLHLPDRRQDIGEEEAWELLRLSMQRDGDTRVKALQDAVEALLGLPMQAFLSEDRKGAELDVDGFRVQANGAGVREALRLVFETELHRPHILLVEEPEIHLHPGLELQVRRYLWELSAETQIFASTHSTNLLEMGLGQNVYLTRGKGGATSVRLVREEDLPAEIPDELGLTLASVFMYETVILVEGPSDAAILRELAPTAGVNLAAQNVGIISMGGAQNMRYYAADEILDTLAKRRVRLVFVLDGDWREDPRAEKLRAKLGDRAELHVLERTEIENYLFVPHALTTALALIASPQDTDVADVERVKAQLSQAIQSCKGYTIRTAATRRLLAPAKAPEDRRDALPDEPSEAEAPIESILDEMAEEISKRRQRVEEVLDETRRQVEVWWEKDPRVAVSGKKVLKKLWQTFHHRYKWARDAVHIAAHMRREDVSQEIKELLKRVTR